MTFFEPTPAFARWLARRAGGRLVIDVGCGDGALLERLRAAGCRRFLGVDRYAAGPVIQRFLLRGVHVVPLPAEDFSLCRSPDALLVIARPCHDGFCGRVVRAARGEVLYVGLPENVEADIPAGFRAVPVPDAPACPEERVYVIREESGDPAMTLTRMTVDVPGNPGLVLGPAERAALAAAVHDAVCEVSGGDGFRRCLNYAWLGAAACHWATGARYVPKFGGLLVRVARDGDKAHWFEIDGSNNGLERQEFHGWVARPDRLDETRVAAGSGTELVDFSARYYRRMHETLPVADGPPVDLGNGVRLFRLARIEPVPWTEPDPPDYVWADGELPDGLALVPDAASCLEFVRRVESRRDAFQGMLGVLRRHFLRAGFTPVPPAEGPNGGQR